MGHVSLVRNSHLQLNMEHGILWLGIRSSNIQWELSVLVGNPQLQHTMGHVSFNWNSQLQQTMEHDFVWLGIYSYNKHWNPSLGWEISATPYSETCFFGWEFTITSYNGASSFFSAGTAHLQHTMDMILCLGIHSSSVQSNL